jgi:branched-chain amino acid transport system substrate-binding protein
MVTHDLLVVQVLPPAELKEPHGWYKVLATVPSAEAFPAATAAECHMTN